MAIGLRGIIGPSNGLIGREPASQVRRYIRSPDSGKAAGSGTWRRAKPTDQAPRQIRAAVGFGVAAVEEVEHRRRRAALDDRADLPGDIGEPGGCGLGTGEAHVSDAVAESGENGAGLLAAIEHRGHGAARKLRSGNLNQRGKPGRTRITAGTDGARQRYRHAERLCHPQG